MEIKQLSWKTNETRLNQRRNLKIPWDKWQLKHNPTKIYGIHQSSPYREVHNKTGFPQKTRKVSIKQPNLSPEKFFFKWTNKT